MDSQDVSNIFALTLFVAAAVTVVGVARPSGRTMLSRHALPIVSIAAIGATAGSLYFSEIADFEPCLYCWYQRIAMYPMALIVPIALVVGDRAILRSSLALGGVGLAISLYHIQLQLFPDQDSTSCSLTSPCTAKWVEAFGFMTIPQMAGTTFAIIVAVSVVGLRTPPTARDVASPSDLVNSSRTERQNSSRVG